MVEAGVSVIPGWNESISSVEEAKTIADDLGYPVIIKAALGGGGKGMRTAFSEAELEQAFLTAKAEAKAAFGEDAVYMEHLMEILCIWGKGIVPFSVIIRNLSKRRLV